MGFFGGFARFEVKLPAWSRAEQLDSLSKFIKNRKPTCSVCFCDINDYFTLGILGRLQHKANRA